MSHADLLEHTTRNSVHDPSRDIEPQSSVPRWTPSALAQRILVATDGSRAGGAALRIARELLARKRSQVAQVHVLTVLRRPKPAGAARVVLDSDVGSLPWDTRATLARIRRQVRAVGMPGWDVCLEFGSPARSICNAATRVGATIIVIGIGRHTTTGRLFGADTARRVVAHAKVPVLAVRADATTLDRSAVAAVDFSSVSGPAASAALSLVEPPDALHLVHVHPRFDSSPPEMEGYRNIYVSGVEAALRELRGRLSIAPGVTGHSYAVAGQPDAAILDLSRRLNAGVIVIGRHGHGLGERLMIGSTTTPSSMLLRARSSSYPRRPERGTTTSRHQRRINDCHYP